MNPDTLRQLIASCRSGRSRTVGRPSVWLPKNVRDPSNPEWPFTDAGAWHFIADLLESGHEYYEMVLDNPAGAKAICLTVVAPPPDPAIYIKVQIGAGNKAIGRSFHNTSRLIQ